MKPGTVQLICPNLRCRRVLTFPSSSRGKLVQCTACLRHLRVPEAKGTTPPPASKE